LRSNNIFFPSHISVEQTAALQSLCNYLFGNCCRCDWWRGPGDQARAGVRVCAPAWQIISSSTDLSQIKTSISLKLKLSLMDSWNDEKFSYGTVRPPSRPIIVHHPAEDRPDVLNAHLYLISRTSCTSKIFFFYF